jgi:hypothetical protein
MSEGRFTTRRGGVTIPREIMPIYGIGRDEKEKKECLFVRQDGTVVCRYPLDKIIVYRHPEYFKEGNGHETSWGLGVLINKYQRSPEPEFLQIHKVAVHPYNVRYIPPEKTNSVQLSKLIGMAKSRDLAIPMVVVPVDRNVIAILQSIAEKAKKLGLDPEEVLSGIIWRKVRYESLSKDHRLVAREDDEVYSALVSKASKFGRIDPEIEYLIVDGFLRYYASYRAFVEEPDAWNSIPEVYARVLQAGIDILSVAYISRRVNSYEREIDSDFVAMSAFANLFDLGEVVMKLGERAGIRGLEELGKGWGPSRPQAVGSVKPDVEDFKFRAASLEAGEEEAVAEEGKPEEEGREERRRERKEEPARHADVSEVQKQFAPTPSYVPAQPQPSAQVPISPPAQPSREEVLKTGALPSVAEVLAEFLWFQKDSLKPRKDTLLQSSVGNEAKLTIDFSHVSPLMQGRIAKKLRSERLETTVVAVPFDNFVVKLNDIELLASGYLLFYKTNQGLLECPNPKCRALVPLGPIRCLRCGQLIEDVFPYEFSFSPRSSK